MNGLERKEHKTLAIKAVRARSKPATKQVRHVERSFRLRDHALLRRRGQRRQRKRESPSDVQRTEHSDENPWRADPAPARRLRTRVIRGL